MIDSITIKNFQCHENAQLEFCSGVNVIAGTSDSGKSAILKALLWALTNKPQGLSFRHWDCEKGDMMSVSIDINGHVIERNRSEAENEYWLSGKKFVAMKADVPSDIQEAHGLTAINMQTQFMPHYLLSASSGEVARALNEACDLSIIDRTIRAVNSITAEAKKEAHTASTLIDDATEKLDQLTWVPDAEAELALLESAWEKLHEKEVAFDQLQEFILAIETVEHDLESYNGVLEAYTDLPALVVLTDEIYEKYQHIQSMEKLLVSLDDADERLSEIRVFPDVDFDNLLEQADACRKIQEQLTALDRLGIELKQVHEAINETQEIIDKIDEELADIWEEEDECPLCGHAV